MKAMILAAGLGTRLKPWTDEHPKALARINGKSLLQRNIEYLQKFGITDIIINVHHFANQVTNSLHQNKGWGSKIQVSDETGEVLETGGGLMKASTYFRNEKSFMLINVDILTDLNLHAMMEAHHKENPLATLATSHRQTSRYLLFNDKNNLCGWRNVKTQEEKRSASFVAGKEVQKAFNGIHIINTSLFSVIKQQGKFSMIDVYLSLMDKYAIKSFEDSGSTFIDVGKPQSITLAEQFFK